MYLDGLLSHNEPYPAIIVRKSWKTTLRGARSQVLKSAVQIVPAEMDAHGPLELDHLKPVGVDGSRSSCARTSVTVPSRATARASVSFWRLRMRAAALAGNSDTETTLALMW